MNNLVITSTKNELVKQLIKIMNNKKDRDKEGLFIVEGRHLVEEAIKANVVEEIIISDKSYHYENNHCIYVTDEIMNKICDTKTPQGVIALCKQQNIETFPHYDRLLLLDNIQDPGNLGTIIRTCDAFNFDGIVLNLLTADIYNPKVVRATQGAIFRVPIIRKNLLEYIPELKKMGIMIFGTALKGENLSGIEPCEKMAFILGNEGNGVSEELLNITHKNIYIEMNGSSESLNVGIAGAIIMYKYRK